MVAQTLPVALLVAALASACGERDVRFSADVVPVFEAKCASAGCHATQEPTGMSLTRENAHGATVGVPSRIADAPIVQPFAPDESYLMSKVQARPDDLGGEGESMPPPFGLGEGDVAILRAWIEQGALDD